MTIGDFSRATLLSAKALRHYHRLGLLEPATVDPGTGYRTYGVEQVPDAQLIRHFRSLEMPLDVIGQLLRAEDAERTALIAAHLQRMEDRLAETRDAVTALRGLLASEGPTVVVRRTVEATPALVLRDVIALDDLGEWFAAAQAEIDEALTASGATPSGPLGGLWSSELILDEGGEVALFRPVAAADGLPGLRRVRYEVLPSATFAVATHRGPEATVAQVYAELGQHVARHETGLAGPVRESYLSGVPGVEGVTEIGWPIA
ncbi:hypothetical protein ASD11_10160 [Aeromicrobium sp. Root495]|uniref:MerR family transcriptional regulator n=1 Tax=Aeromicrobium sp. Root495 TaxID=1736550 RepID=UPI0006FD7533|nr:MerR family transcriptional regulator [Aeromicrobium sp. Root495]KQY60757.1 hypothetical protein ASD11_10160 [Aeromicrobium sp. Root495]